MLESTILNKNFYFQYLKRAFIRIIDIEQHSTPECHAAQLQRLGHLMNSRFSPVGSRVGHACSTYRTFQLPSLPTPYCLFRRIEIINNFCKGCTCLHAYEDGRITKSSIVFLLLSFLFRKIAQILACVQKSTRHLTCIGISIY